MASTRTTVIVTMPANRASRERRVFVWSVIALLDIDTKHVAADHQRHVGALHGDDHFQP